MQVVGGESLQLPTATAGAWQQATYNTSLSGRAGAAGCGSGCEQGESRHGMAGEIGQRNNLLEGKMMIMYFSLWYNGFTIRKCLCSSLSTS